VFIYNHLIAEGREFTFSLPACIQVVGYEGFGEYWVFVKASPVPFTTFPQIFPLACG